MKKENDIFRKENNINGYEKIYFQKFTKKIAVKNVQFFATILTNIKKQPIAQKKLNQN